MASNLMQFEQTQEECGVKSSSLPSDVSAPSEQDPLGQLPIGWEQRVDEEHRVYFVNRKRKTAQWEDPRTQGNIGGVGAPVQQEYNLSWKLGQFRRQCQRNQSPDDLGLVIDEEMVLQDSVDKVMSLETSDLQRHLQVMFQEDGFLRDGVTRQWIVYLLKSVMSPDFGLFKLTGPENDSLQIDAASSGIPNHLRYFKFVGRLIALALLHGHFIGGGLTTPYYKMLLKKPLTVDDVLFLDPGFHHFFTLIQESDIEDLALCFALEYELLGEFYFYELTPGGAEILVTEENKWEYIRLLLD